MLGIEFEEYKFPLTQQEEQAKREFEYKYNMSSPIDWIMQDTGIDQEEAIKKIEDNLTENKKIKDLERKNTLLDRILGANNANSQNQN